MKNTFEAGQEVHSPIVEPRQAIRRSRELKIRDVRQLTVPPQRMNRGVRSKALVKRIVQILQRNRDDPRSASGSGGDLGLSGFEDLCDGGRNLGLWSLSRPDVVQRRGGEIERVCGSGSCEDRGGGKSVLVGKWWGLNWKNHLFRR